MPQDRETEFNCRPAIAATIAVGCLLALGGGFVYFAGFPPVDNRPIASALGDPSAATADIRKEIGEDTPVTHAQNSPPEIADTVTSLLQRGSDSSRWILILGLLLAVLGICKLQKEIALSKGSDDSYLQSTYADGIDPATLYADEEIEEFQSSVAKLHQQKVLWSLPFWFTTLIFLIVNKGSLGNETFIGISDLWFMGGTFGIYVLFSHLYWHCPACEAPLGKHHDRLTCDKCGMRLVSKRIHFAPLDVA